MRHPKRIAATFFFAGVVALGVAPAASAATAPGAVSSNAGQVQVPAYWHHSCKYDMWDQKSCQWIWVPNGQQPPGNGTCYGGYGPMCPGFAVEPRQTSSIGQA